MAALARDKSQKFAQVSSEGQDEVSTMNWMTGHIIRTNLFFFLNVLVQGLRGLVLIPLFLRLMHPVGYGQWVLVMSWAGYALVVALVGLDLSIYQYVTPKLRTDSGRSIYWMIVRIALFWTAALYLIVAGTAVGCATGDVTRIVLFGGLYVCGQTFWMLFLAPFRCEERTYIFLLSQILITLGDFLVTVFTAFAYRALPPILFALAAYHLSVALLLFLIQRRRTPYRAPLKLPMRSYFTFGASMTATQLITMGFFVMDKSIITYFTGLQTLASYGPALSLALILLPLSAAGTVTLPTLLVRTEVRNSVEIKKAILRSAIKHWGLLALPCALGIAMLAQFALTILASTALAKTGTSITWVATAALLADGLTRFANVALRTEGDIYWPAYVKVVHFIVFLLVGVAAVAAEPHHAGLLVISTILITNLSYMIFCYARLRRYIPHLLQPRIFTTPLVGCAAITAWFVFSPALATVLNALLFVAISVVIYGVVIMMMERVSPGKLARTLFKFSPPQIQAGQQ